MEPKLFETVAGAAAGIIFLINIKYCSQFLPPLVRYYCYRTVLGGNIPMAGAEAGAKIMD